MPEGASSAWRDRSRALIFVFNDRLNSVSQVSAWLVLAFSVMAIPIGDYLIHPADVHLGPLYVLPICLACWRLTLRVWLGIALLAAILSVAMRSVSLHDLSVGAMLTNMVLQALALGFVAAIISNFRFSLERERIVARHDSITGTLTRLAFEHQAKIMMATAVAEDRPLLLAFLDLDGFKSINDRFGHDAGDRALKRFAAEGGAALRQGDCFGRIGGDEFAVLMPLVSVEEAEEITGHLHRRLTGALAGTAYNATCSMGALVVLPTGDTTLDDIMREADRLMYAVKRHGKSGVQFGVHAPPLEPDEDFESSISAGLGQSPLAPHPTALSRDALP